MSLSRLSFTLILSTLVAGCGARSFGGPSEDASVTSDSHVQVYDSYGYVALVHQQSSNGGYPQENLYLQASFYEAPWDNYAPGFGWPDPVLVETPDGVPCELRYESGMDGPIPPEPPQALDGGDVIAWAGPDEDDSLEIRFIGGGYDGDYRSASGSGVWPAWVRSTALDVHFESTGSAHSPLFVSELTLPDSPLILSPPESLDEPLTPDPDGTYNIVWGPVQADRMEVVFTFNLDWDNSNFRCYPDEGQLSMKLPHQWLVEYTWGSGEMMVKAVNEHVESSGDGAVTLRTMRVVTRSISVLVWE